MAPLHRDQGLGRGVLWDMDGVLVNTGQLHYRSWLAVLNEYGIALTIDRFRTTFGMNNTGVLATLLGREPEPQLVMEVSRRKEEWFRQAARGQVETFPGVRTWLRRLQAEGYRQAIASSAPTENIDALVDELELRGYFAALVSGADLPGKPDPSTYLKAAQALGLPPGRCIVIEDASVGVQGARRAGMKCIAVATTHRPDELRAADIVVERLDLLPLDTFVRLR